MFKSFFNEDSSVNDNGAKALIKFDDVFSKIYNEYLELGYNLREVSLILMNSMTLSESKKSLEISEKAKKKKREESAAAFQKKVKEIK